MTPAAKNGQPAPLALAPHEARLILRLRQLNRLHVSRVIVDLANWHILEKVDARPEDLRDRPEPEA